MNKKNIQNFIKRPGRKITVQGIKWVWQVGKGGYVKAYSENGLMKLAHASIKHVDPDTWDRGQYKQTSDGQLTPKEIAAWLTI